MKKTASSRRRVPLHPGLLGHFGFQEYLNSVAAEQFLFPILNQGSIVKGAVSHAFSKWFGRFLKTIGLGSKKLTYHSFRHTLKSLGRSYNIEKSLLDCLQGHSEGAVSLSYGIKGNIEKLTLCVLNDSRNSDIAYVHSISPCRVVRESLKDAINSVKLLE